MLWEPEGDSVSVFRKKERFFVLFLIFFGHLKFKKESPKQKGGKTIYIEVIECAKTWKEKKEYYFQENYLYNLRFRQIEIKMSLKSQIMNNPVS